MSEHTSISQTMYSGSACTCAAVVHVCAPRPLFGCNITGHAVTDVKQIKLKNKGKKRVLVILMDIFTVSTFFRTLNPNKDMSMASCEMLPSIIKDLGGEMDRVVTGDLKKGAFFVTIYFTNCNNGEFSMTWGKMLSSLKGSNLFQANKLLNSKKVCNIKN